MMLRTLSDRTTVHRVSGTFSASRLTWLTFILANVFESKRKSGVFALYYPHLAKSTFAHDP